MNVSLSSLVTFSLPLPSLSAKGRTIIFLEEEYEKKMFAGAKNININCLQT